MFDDQAIHEATWSYATEIGFGAGRIGMARPAHGLAVSPPSTMSSVPVM